MLTLMWNISLFLAVGSVATMLSLLLLRVRDARREKDMEAVRKELRMAYIGFGVEKDRKLLHQAMANAPPHLVVDVSQEFLDLVRGDEKQELESELMMTVLPKLLRETIAKGNEAKRIEATRQIASFKSFETIESLKAALSDRSAAVRLSSAISLGRLGELTNLNETLQVIGPGACRSKEIYTLLKTVPPEDADTLRLMGTDRDAEPNLRAASINALADIGDYAYLPCFEGLARDQNIDVAVAALTALGKFSHPATTKTIMSCMAHGAWEVRLEAARVAGVMGANDAALKLSDLMSDEEWSVRYAAASSLVGMGEQGVRILEKLAGGEASSQQLTASLVLDEAASA